MGRLSSIQKTSGETRWSVSTTRFCLTTSCHYHSVPMRCKAKVCRRVKRIDVSKWFLETKWKAHSKRQSYIGGGDKYTVWIFPVPICTALFMNDSRYGPDESHPKFVGRIVDPWNIPKKNIQSRYMGKPSNSINFRGCNVV